MIALSQAGKPSIIDALGDAVKAVGNGSPSQLKGDAGLGIWRAMAGCRLNPSRDVPKLA